MPSAKVTVWNAEGEADTVRLSDAKVHRKVEGRGKEKRVTLTVTGVEED